MATATKPREPITLRDSTDLLLEINRWIEEHVDEIELAGGALPDELAAMLGAIDATTVKKVDAIAAKLDEFVGYATTAKATKDRAARRQKVWENASTALKAYVLHELARRGVDRLRGASATLRAQINSAPAVECRLDNEALLAICDYDGDQDNIADIPLHPLTKYFTIERTVHIDKRRLGADFEARREELEREAAMLTEHDVAHQAEYGGEVTRIEHARALYVADALSREFPAITVTRGSHLRID
jgi:Siphovirus Gp157